MNFKRRRPRLHTRAHYSRRELKRRLTQAGHYAWMRHWPAWWDLQFHTRPRRARTTELERRVLQGDDPDNIVWPLSKKPHVYYW
jgi:hypothetical protein